MKLTEMTENEKEEYKDYFRNKYSFLIGKYFIYELDSYHYTYPEKTIDIINKRKCEGYIEFISVSLKHDGFYLEIGYNKIPNKRPLSFISFPLIIISYMTPSIVSKGFYYADTLEEAELEYELQKGE